MKKKCRRGCNQGHEICEGCEVIIDCRNVRALSKSSPKNKNRCEGCLHFEDNIKKECGCCGRPIPGTIRFFLLHGNFCYECMREVYMNMKR